MIHKLLFLKSPFERKQLLTLITLLVTQKLEKNQIQQQPQKVQINRALQRSQLRRLPRLGLRIYRSQSVTKK